VQIVAKEVLKVPSLELQEMIILYFPHLLRHPLFVMIKQMVVTTLILKQNVRSSTSVSVMEVMGSQSSPSSVLMEQCLTKR